MDLAVDDLFDGRYRIVARRGQGARGVVYRARDLAVEPEQADVCLKLLHRDAVRAGEGEALRLAFALLARLRHPNLVAVKSHGSAYGVPYLVSETVDGPRLDRALGGRPVGELLPLATGLARALAYLHGNGHVHQDVKPANVLVARADDPDVRAWVPKLADLGATHLPGSDPETGVRLRAGTLEYLSPERLRGGAADARADLWALGVTLFTCAAGRPPIDARTGDELLRRIEAGQIPALRDVCPAAPPELERLVGWLLAIDPRERPVDGGEVLAVLERVAGAHGDDVGRAEPAALVGRDRAIARVLTAFGPRPTPAPRTVLLAAPAGAGRSRFLAEIAIRAQLTGGRAARVPAGSGLLPWRQALVALGDDAGGDLAADELAERMAAAAVRAATVIVVDDLDRRDRLAHEVVDRLARSLAGRPCGVRSGLLVAAGAGAAPRDPSVAIAVALVPLDEAAIRDLAASVLAGEPPAALPAVLARDSGGSPARVVHALQHLRAVGALRRLGGRWDLDDDATAILGTDAAGDRRLAAAPPAARAVLAAVALFGPGAQVPLVVLHHVIGGDEDATLAAAQQACAAQLLRVGPDQDDGGLVLEHRAERVRAASEAAIDPAARARLHGRALAALRAHGEGDPLVLGPHALAAGLVDDARRLARAALRAAIARRDPLSTLAAAELAIAAAASAADDRRAAEVVRARALLDLGRIADARTAARAVAADAPTWPPAALVAARAAIAFGDHGEATAMIARLEELLAAGGPAVDVAELALVRIESVRLTDGPQRALDLGEAQLARASAGDPRSRLQLHLALGQAAIAVVDHPRAQRQLEAALALAVALGDPAGTIDACGWLGALADMAGASDVAMAHVERGLAEAARTTAGVGLARLLHLRGILCIWSGRLDDAADSLIEAERRARVAHGGRLVSAIAGNLVVIHRRRGRYGQALAASLRSLDQKRRLGDRAGLVVAHVNLADVYVELGELELALAAARRAETGARDLGLTRAWAQARLARAAVELARGEPAAALAALDDAEPLVDERDHVGVWLTRAAALHARAATPAALAVLDRVLARTATTGDLYDEARARTLRAHAQPDEAFDELRRAADAATRAGARAIAWLAHAELGVLYQRVGLADEAAGELVRGRELLDEVTADLPARHVERYRHAAAHAALVAAVEATGGAATGR